MLGLEESLKYEKGLVQVETIAIKLRFSDVDVAKERTMLDMTPKTFASILGVSKCTIEAWKRKIQFLHHCSQSYQPYK